MSAPIFDERPIAVIWDFDKTLIRGSMQWPLFERFDVSEDEFWDEANQLGAFYAEQGLDLVSDDTLYLNHILSYVRAGKFPDLSNEMLRTLGRKIKFYPGIQTFLANTRSDRWQSCLRGAQDMSRALLVSTGLRQMILGSKVANLVDQVWACEFAEQAAGPGYHGSGAGPVAAVATSAPRKVSSSAAASAAVPGIRCPYRSNVTLIELWPMKAESALARRSSERSRRRGGTRAPERGAARLVQRLLTGDRYGSARCRILTGSLPPRLDHP
jgi:hypothetical protein